MNHQFWAGKKVLVTGAGGFIASHLVESLLRAGAKVRGFVRYTSRGQVGFLAEIDDKSQLEVVAGDLRDPDAVDQAVRGEEILFHLGALISIPYSYIHPLEVVETNISGTMNVLMASRKYGVQKVVHTSTSEVYGSARTVPIDEEHPLQGQSPYSASKIGADKLVESFYCAYSMPVVTIRPFNTFGPRQSARAVIPTIISQALTRDVIHLGNLDTKRDFTYVDDTVRGFIKAGEMENISGHVINLGTGLDTTIGDLVQTIIRMIGRQVKIEREEQRMRPDLSEVRWLLANNKLASMLLGWEPEVSLAEGLRRTIDWIKDHIEIYDPDKYIF